MNARNHICFPIFALLLFLPTTRQADARYLEVWTMDRFAKSAQVLAVGELVGTERVGGITPDDTIWGIHLLKMQAKVKVLRAYPDIARLGLGKDSTIAVTYEAIDWEKTRGVGNGPMFPEMEIGDIRIFPVLRHSDAGPWDLVGREGAGLLIPAGRMPIDAGSTADGLQFMQSELAALFVNGTYEDMYEASCYLRDTSFSRNKTSQAVATLLDDRIDEQRWLQAAVASYAATVPTPLTSVETLKSEPTETNPYREFMVLALNHVPDDDLDERFVETLIRNMEVHPRATATALSAAYARHPTTVKLLTEALSKTNPKALYVSQQIVRQPDHPLIPQALKAARKILSGTYGYSGKSAAFHPLTPACDLILDYGDKEDLGLLVREVHSAQTRDRTRYHILWTSCSGGLMSTKRVIPVIRVVIQDGELFNEGQPVRFSDLATHALERITGQEFGDPLSKNEAERDKAVAMAKEWLAANPDPL